jgi:hypothetical protein
LHGARLPRQKQPHVGALALKKSRVLRDHKGVELPIDTD